MQTFLPYSSFKESARVLDYRRLGKQRVECLQILRTLVGINQGWRNHPAVKMWKGYEVSLGYYALTICKEWIDRGYRDNCDSKIRVILGCYFYDPEETDPVWLGNEDFHASHRAALLAKNFEHYKQFGWKEKPEIKYVWPLVVGEE